MKTIPKLLRFFGFGQEKGVSSPEPLPPLPPLNYPSIIGVDSQEPVALADAICFTMAGTEQKVVTCYPLSFASAGVKAMFGWKTLDSSVDPDIGAAPLDLVLAVHGYLATMHPGIWRRAVERAHVLSSPDVFIVFGIDDEICEWIREQGGIIVGDRTATYPCHAVIDDPLDLQTLADTLEKLK